MNINLNGNENLFIFLPLHLHKHNFYVRICLLVKDIIFSKKCLYEDLFVFFSYMRKP